MGVFVLQLPSIICREQQVRVLTPRTSDRSLPSLVPGQGGGEFAPHCCSQEREASYLPTSHCPACDRGKIPVGTIEKFTQFFCPPLTHGMGAVSWAFHHYEYWEP